MDIKHPNESLIQAKEVLWVPELKAASVLHLWSATFAIYVFMSYLATCWAAQFTLILRKPYTHHMNFEMEYDEQPYKQKQD